MTPLSALATGGIEREFAGSASAMFNMMRNLGGSVGIAALETFVTKREQFHSSIITGNVSLLNEATRQRIASLQAYFMANGASDAGSAWREAVVQIGRTVRAQSYLLAYSDAFYLMGVALVLALITSAGMRKSSGGGAGSH
jgi:DHA2 family multidrug resistance protein